jgi:hypothetical protein
LQELKKTAEYFSEVGGSPVEVRNQHQHYIDLLSEKIS